MKIKQTVASVVYLLFETARWTLYIGAGLFFLYLIGEVIGDGVVLFGIAGTIWEGLKVLLWVFLVFAGLIALMALHDWAKKNKS